MGFDLPSAAPPELLPLRESFDPGDYRDSIKQLTLDLFDKHLGKQSFDANVLGMAHLGSFDLVRRCIQADGLGMLRSDQEEAATRYLYRAWRAQDTQGRGLHFLRTYLQLLFPGEAELEQLWHDSRFPYGDAFLSGKPRTILRHFLGEPGLKVDGAWRLGEFLDAPYVHTPDPDELWLTSRIQVRLSLEYIAQSVYTTAGKSRVSHLYPIIESIVPARLVPIFVFWLVFVLNARPWADYQLRMGKQSTWGYPWCGRVLSEYTDKRWSLGRDGALVTLGEPFGTFRLGERRGGLSVWHLKACRAQGNLTGRLAYAASAYRPPMVGEPWRRLDGAWAVGRRQSEAFGRARLAKSVAITQPQRLVTRLCEHVLLQYPYTPSKLNMVRTLDGRWRLGPRALPLGKPVFARTLGDLRLGRHPSIPAESVRRLRKFSAAYIAPRRLPDRAGVLTLNGWKIGSFFPLAVRSVLHGRYQTDVAQTVESARELRQEIRIRYPANPRAVGRDLALDGRWRVSSWGTNQRRLGQSINAMPLNGWPLRRAAARVLPRSPTLNGRWPLAPGARLSAPQHGRLRLGGWAITSHTGLAADQRAVVRIAGTAAVSVVAS